jgi:TetR/AcrR family transcriptional regulator, fatty acid metabolism regulator protein
MKSDRMDQIIDAAEQVMSEKGFANSSIAEIAKAAGIKDSLIYNYFSGKEDLLFSIPLRRMSDVVQEMSGQLAGILDPVSRLTKMIWFHLNYNDTHRGYARLLLLECLANRNFYYHKAYAFLRRYAGMMKAVLQEGIEEGVFASRFRVPVVRDVILGLLDSETLNCVGSEEIESCLLDFEDINALILPMIRRVDAGDSVLDKRTSILRVAEKVFAEKGYGQATVSEIAKSAGVAEGTVYEYFTNKEDLLLSIPKQRFQEHIDSLDDIFEVRAPLRKLRRLIRYHFYLYLREPDFLKVFLLNVQLNQVFYKSEIYPIYRKYTDTILRILEEGKEDGSIRSDVNNRVFLNLFLGSFSHITLRWVVLGKAKETDKMEEIDDLVALLIRSVASKPEKTHLDLI